MITLLNREEVYFGNSEARYREICEILAQNNIRFTTRYKQTTHGYPFGLSGKKRSSGSDWTKQYYIYVHRDDREAAGFLIRRSE